MGEETGGAAPSWSSSAARVPVQTVFHPTVELPVLRTEWHGGPTYGYDSVKFSVEVHHGGFFAGKGVNLTYLDEKITWFDNLDRNTLYVVEINLENDCFKMARASVYSKVLVLFVKHIREQNQEEEDDIAIKGSPALPIVIMSPFSIEKIRNMKSGTVPGSSDNAAIVEQQADAAGSEDQEKSDVLENSEVSEEDDYGMEAEDDKDYDKNVDDVLHDAMVEKGKNIGAEYRHVPGSDDVHEDDLQLPEEDDCEKRHKSDSDDEEYKAKKKKEKPIYRKVRKKFNMEVSRHKLGRARKAALEVVRGDEVKQYSLLWRYAEEIYPTRDKDEWAAVSATPILPPLYERRAGRRRKNRRQQPEESEDGTKLRRHGAIMHCGYCKEAGHNRSGFSKLKAAVIREVGGDDEEHVATDQTEQAEQVPEQTEHVPKQHEQVPEQTEHVAEQPEQVPEQTEHVAEPNEQVRAKSSRGRKRKPTDKMNELVQQLMEKAKKKKSKMVIDENGDVDFPVILTMNQHTQHKEQEEQEGQEEEEEQEEQEAVQWQQEEDQHMNMDQTNQEEEEEQILEEQEGKGKEKLGEWSGSYLGKEQVELDMCKRKHKMSSRSPRRLRCLMFS
nr:golgin subfamily A member 6-like protein 6 [Aegilops tauschii subsp. strangulata]